jgi:hypothetical protein
MKTTRNLLWCAFATISLMSLPALPLWGQNTNTGEIKGSVTDSSGAVIANATVTDHRRADRRGEQSRHEQERYLRCAVAAAGRIHHCS